MNIQFKDKIQSAYISIARKMSKNYQETVLQELVSQSTDVGLMTRDSVLDEGTRHRTDHRSLASEIVLTKQQILAS